MDPTSRSGIGRPIDPRCRSNLYILIVTPLAGIVAGIVALAAGDDLGAALRSGLYGGGASFLAWAIGREVEPDRPAAAGVAAVIAPVAVLAGNPSLGQLFAVLLAARILVRSTGLAPRPADLVVVLGLATYVATRPGGLPVALILAMALAADVRLPGGAPQASAIVALAAVAAAVIAAVLADTVRIEPIAPDAAEWVIAAVAGLGALLVVQPPRVLSPVDTGEAPISPLRLQAGRISVAAAGIGGVAWIGGPALGGLAAAWAAMTAALLVGALPRRSDS